MPQIPDIKDQRFVTSMFPLVKTRGNVGFDSIKRAEVSKIINSHLKMLLLTNPGEIISDSSFGVGLYQRLFLMENETSILNLKSDITRQISKYLQYLDNYRVLIDSSMVSQNKLGVRIEYKLNESMAANTLTFIVDETTVTTQSAGPTSGGQPSLLGDVLAERGY